MATIAMRQGSASDAVDGVVPRQVVEPESAADVAEALSTASRDRLVTVLRGGGTKLGWGRTPVAIDRVVSTVRLNTQIVHRHGDLTATAHAGVTLKQLNQQLARYGQWLPIDSAFEDATIGGIVATNDAGPLRHRFGTPRDLLIGVSLAMPDGRLIKAGGHVVKNVAGYDLGKFISGSFGSFAAIVDATFKLLPVPQASATLIATYQDVERMTRDAHAIGGSQLEPIAFDVRVPPVGRAILSRDADPREGKTYQLLLRLASSPSAVDAQVLSVQRMLTGQVSMRRDADESALWSDHVRAPWLQDGAVVRVAWLPAKLDDVITLLEEVQRMADGRVGLSGRVGAGTGLLAIEGDVMTQAAVINRLRSSVFVGNVTVLRASRELKAQVDVWSLAAGPMKTLQALKQSFDSAGIMNAGRGPI